MGVEGAGPDHGVSATGSRGRTVSRDEWFEEVKPPVTRLTFEEQVYFLTDGAAAVLIRKHKDYGPKNISLSPGGPLNGLRVRMWDKLARINNLIESGAAPENESLRDSFLDLANYSLIACMVLDGTWPSE